MRRARTISALLLAIVLSTWGTSAEAGPITGSFSISGNYLPVEGSPPVLTSLELATGIDFIELFGSEPTPGMDGEFLVNSAKGDFGSLTGKSGMIRDFTFIGSGGFPSTPLISFQSVAGITFDLLTVAVVMQSADFLVLSGTGVFHMTGFDATAGTFKLTGNAADGTFSFSASDRATQATTVPEPHSLAFFGVSMLFGAAVRFGKRSV